VLVGVDLDAGEFLDLPGEGLTEVGRAPGDRVLVAGTACGFFEGGEEFLRRIKVRESLGKVDRTVPVGEAGHPADDGFGEDVEAVGGAGHGRKAGCGGTWKRPVPGRHRA